MTAERRQRLTEITRFGIVGGINWVVDLVVFNAARWVLPLNLVLLAKIIAVLVAATLSWFINRRWTFQARATNMPHREVAIFMAVNALGMLPPLLCLWVSHYLLGFTSALADNISANVVGLALGTLVRYFGYRHLVFTGGAPKRTSEPA